MTSVLSVALGGALGASLRFLLVSALMRDGFPVAILFCNVLGSFLMGLLVVLLGHHGLPQLQPFLLAGVLGGFTTFSAFSLETLALIEQGALGQAFLYVAASVLLSLLALTAGLWLARSFA
ncbi:fluoride efflux transporter CrcB [Jannaschia seohaensis]|uniref:Fluoride-specific ion channel FluC n=1 Tax=Jannaschia seohaensis TaxID=475081 RepID=A0A2Y9C0S7_9RHOB|nr:fluoride efflux transporter CrcB [Jannaschia seohaensis]PWJ18267.1 CrcB protein [Jannaschia seohaensis]SSA46792.1 CrcB protein [Jannaschia seohaensis]